LDLKWENVDLERGVLLLPDSKTGRKTIVLNEAAIDILKGHPRIAPYVIAGDKPDMPRTDLKKPWAAICKHAALEGVRLHDLRHTFASIGAGASLGLPIVGHRPSFGGFDGGPQSRQGRVTIVGRPGSSGPITRITKSARWSKSGGADSEAKT
jgi:hypothetical protein